jgi:hypothetical protein
LERALVLASQGFAPFAAHGVNPDGTCACGGNCAQPGKAPVETFLQEKRSLPLRHPLEIRSGWGEAKRRFNGPVNIGIATGHPHGYVVVDVDPKDDGYTTLMELEKVYGVLPDTQAVVTGSGGRHLYYREARPLKGGRAGLLGSGIDVKAFHAYVIGPGSTHKSGYIYFWVPGFGPGEIEMAELPEPWAEAIHTKGLAGPAAEYKRRPAMAPVASRFDLATAKRVAIALFTHPCWQWATEHADEISRPTWMGFATNMVAACDGHEALLDAGRTAFRELSMAYAGYKQRETDKVYDDAVRFIFKGGGPHRWPSMPDVPDALRGTATTLVEEARRSIFRN